MIKTYKALSPHGDKLFIRSKNMDPNANLKEIREIIREFYEDEKKPDRDYSVELYNKLRRLVELTDALDGWISKGGFLPREWTLKEKETP